MSTHLDLADIQGNILRAYGKQNFPIARYFFLHFLDGPRDSAQTRLFVRQLSEKVTTATRWPKDEGESESAAAHGKNRGLNDYPGAATVDKPKVAVNIAFAFWGLIQLGVPIRTLQSMPQEFIDGMPARASVLRDPEPGSAGDNRDAIWRQSKADNRVHALVALNAQMDEATGKAVPELESETQALRDLCAQCGGRVRILPGHGRDGADYQEAAALTGPKPGGGFRAISREHFGFADGMGDPVFEGQYTPEAEKLRVRGGGKIEPGDDQSWAPLATGEFLLGYPDEAQETPGAAMPIEFSRNGSFLAYRKLHQNVKAFEDHISAQAEIFNQVAEIGDSAKAAEWLKAKMVGRWPDGIPLAAAPTPEAHADYMAAMAKARADGDKAAVDKLTLQLFDFKYRDDPEGRRCPLGAHIRRGNTRDMLDPTGDLPGERFNGSVLNNRRRILRRGLPYGASIADDGSEHGVIFMAVCASLFRQFEFVQQQWMQYGLDFEAGNDTCPLIGMHDESSKFVVPAAEGAPHPPFISAPLPNFVECRGGDYFFIPSMTALRLIGSGITDPT